LAGKINWDGFRTEFPATKELLYLNSAAISPMSTRVRAAIDEVNDLFVRKGILAEEEVCARVAAIRESAARLIGAYPGEIAFTRNTTHGVLLAANGIRWKAGDNVVMPSIEFPANVYPWMGLFEKGVELRMVEPDDGVVTAEMLIDVCDRKTRAVTASLVQFSTGHRIDCEELGRYCRNRGIFLNIDAIQALGALKIDVKRCGIDFLSCGGHKFMLATPGIGIFYCRAELIDTIDVAYPGWTGVVNSRDFLNYDLTWRGDAARFEEGSSNFQGIYGLGASIDRFLEIGPEITEERILFLTGLLAEGLEKRGYTVTSPFGEGERSGIICFTHPRMKSADIHGRLAARSVACSLREGAVRLSPHIYNVEEDIERFFEKLEAGS
jgi:selenocysteine lyase/cysteine desulfurase